MTDERRDWGTKDYPMTEAEHNAARTNGVVEGNVDSRPRPNIDDKLFRLILDLWMTHDSPRDPFGLRLDDVVQEECRLRNAEPFSLFHTLGKKVEEQTPSKEFIVSVEFVFVQDEDDEFLQLERVQRGLLPHNVHEDELSVVGDSFAQMDMYQELLASVGNVIADGQVLRP